MPVRMTGRLMPNGLVVSDELISWLEKDGVCLPTEVSSEETSVETGETRFSSAKIYWRSFNEPISTLFFNSSFLTDTKQLLKSVDEETFIADGVLNGS
jgi:hypothetical protein